MRTAIPLFLVSLFFVQHVTAPAPGIVGFGISMYQDLCCQACYDSLSALYLTCTTFPDGMDANMTMDMGMMGTTSDECYATNTPWLQTMAYCIQDNCKADGYSVEHESACFSTLAVMGASEPTFQDSLPAMPPTVEVAADAMFLNVTSLVNGDLYYATYGTEGEFARSEYIHTRYAVILYLIIIGICIGTGVLAQARSLYPGFQRKLQTSTLWAKLQQHIFLPALFGSRRLEPLPGRIGYVPGRILSIFITIYVIMNIILSSVSFRNFWPNTFFTSPQFEMCEYVGNRTGTLSLVNMSMSILFAGRNNLLIAVTGWSQTTFLTLHRWTARVATVQAVVHSIVYTLAYFEPNSGGAAAYAAKVAQSFYWWGIIATIAMCLVTAFAILPLRIKFYEIFLITHIILVILALVGCWYHLIPHFGYTYGYQVWLYICFAFWGADRFARVVRIASYSHLGGSTAIVEVIPDCDIVQITIFPRDWVFGPGQHTFVHFPTLGKFWESHPFSVAGWKIQRQSVPASTPASLSYSTAEGEKQKNSAVVSVATVPHRNQTQDQISVQFLIRAHAGTTSTLHRRLLSSPSPASMKIPIYTEGPYAGHRATLQPLFTADTILCLVGGIGITNTLGFIQEYKSSPHLSGRSDSGIMKKAKRFILAWSAKEIALIEHIKRNFLQIGQGGQGQQQRHRVEAKAKAEAEGIEYSFWCTDSSHNSHMQKLDSASNEGSQRSESLSPRTAASAAVTPGRMDIRSVIRSAVEVGHQTTVLVCGPGGMADEATREIVNCVADGLRVDLVEEAFAW